MITELIRHSKQPGIHVIALGYPNTVSHWNRWKPARKPVNKRLERSIALFYPRRSSWVSKVVISLRASLGRQKLLISSSRRARAPLSTRAKLPWSKKGSRGPRASRAGPSICPSAWEEPCRAADISRRPGIKGISHQFHVVWQSVEDTADMNLEWKISTPVHTIPLNLAQTSLVMTFSAKFVCL